MITAIGAPAGWFYALSTIGWTLCIAFDIWTGPWVDRMIEEAEEGANKKSRTSSIDDEMLLWDNRNSFLGNVGSTDFDSGSTVKVILSDNEDRSRGERGRGASRGSVGGACQGYSVMTLNGYERILVCINNVVESMANWSGLHS